MFFFNCKTAAEEAAAEARLRDFWAQASSTTIEDKIEEIIVAEEGVKRSELHDELKFWKDFGDSVEFMGILMGCEEEFGFQIPDEDAATQNINTVRDLKNYILKKLGTMS